MAKLGATCWGRWVSAHHQGGCRTEETGRSERGREGDPRHWGGIWKRNRMKSQNLGEECVKKEIRQGKNQYGGQVQLLNKWNLMIQCERGRCSRRGVKSEGKMQWILSCYIAWGAQPVICDDLEGLDGREGIMYICTYNRFMTLSAETNTTL